MKKLFPLLFLFLITCMLSAQDKTGIWSLDLYAAPQYFNYTSSSSSSSDSYESIFSFSIGLAADYRFSKRWSLNTGFVFQNGRKRLNWSGLRWGNQHDLNGGFDPTLPTLEKERKVIREEFYIEIPITVKYYFSTNKKRFYARLGIQPERLIADRFIVGKTETKPKTTTLSTPPNGAQVFNVSMVMGFGLELDLGERTSFFAEPEWKINLLKRVTFVELRKKLLGLRIGATWRMNDL